MAEKILVLVLRRQLDEAEAKALHEAYPGKELEFRTIHPQDYREHDAICQELNPAVVLLPKDRPIPSLAMEWGVPHVALLPNGQLSELLPLIPQFKPFVPR